MKSFHAHSVSVKLSAIFVLIAFAAADLEVALAQGVHNLDSGESFNTITEAIDDTDTLDGHTLSVDPGTYNETVNVNKQLTIQSTSRDPVDTVISSGPYHVVMLGKDDVTIDAMTLEGTGSGWGATIDGSGCTVSNCIIRDCTTGISAESIFIISNLNALNNTIQNCSALGIRVYNTPDSVVSGNTVRECGSISVPAVQIRSSIGCTVSFNTIESNIGTGLQIDESPQAQVTGNTVNNNGTAGIEIERSSNTTMTDNAMTGNAYNFWLHASGFPNPSYFLQDIDTSNSVNGKPIYYYKFEDGIEVPSDAGYVACFQCQNMVISDLSMSNNGTGLLLVTTNDSTIENLDLSYSVYGISIIGCDNNTFSQVHVSYCVEDPGVIGEKIAFVYDSHNMLFDDCEFTNNQAGLGFRFSSSANNTISNSLFEDNWSALISFYGTDNTVIENNVFRSNNRAIVKTDGGNPTASQVLNNQFTQNELCEIFFYGSSDHWITGNSIDQSNGDLYDNVIRLQEVTGVHVTDNVVHNSDTYGISMMDCTGCYIEGNTLSGFDEGAAIKVSYSDSSFIRNNRLKDSLYGIQVTYSDNNSFAHNVFSDFWRGLMIDNSNGNTLMCNTFLECSDIELMFHPGCGQNLIYNNDFLAEVLRVYDVGSNNYWDNGYPAGGNYWSSYNGVDLDGDGIGDTSKEVLPAGNNNYDAYPLMTPANLTFFTDKETISESIGGQIDLTMEAGKGNAFRKYLVVGGISGTDPGQSLPGGLVTLPVNFDAFTYNIVFPFLNTSLFVDFLGTLDADGRAYPVINAPPVPGFAGSIMHYAFCCNNPFDFASNAVAIEIVP